MSVAEKPGAPHCIIVEGVLPDLNQEINNAKKVAYAGKGASRKRIPGLLYAQFKKKWTDIVYYACRAKYPKGKGQITGEVFIYCKWYSESNRKDADNIYFAQKYLLDGLVKASIFQTDGRKQVGPILHDIETDKRHPRVEVYIYPAAFYYEQIKPKLH